MISRNKMNERFAEYTTNGFQVGELPELRNEINRFNGEFIERDDIKHILSEQGSDIVSNMLHNTLIDHLVQLHVKYEKALRKKLITRNHHDTVLQNINQYLAFEKTQKGNI